MHKYLLPQLNSTAEIYKSTGYIIHEMPTLQTVYWLELLKNIHNKVQIYNFF